VLNQHARFTEQEIADTLVARWNRHIGAIAQATAASPWIRNPPAERRA
jgi:hypothetical protein